MSTSPAAPPLRVVPRRGGRAPRSRGWLAPAALALALVAMLSLIGLGTSSERRRLRALPPQQRLAVLARTVEDLRASCEVGPQNAVREHCRELASFASLFDECDGECQRLVHVQLIPNATR